MGRLEARHLPLHRGYVNPLVFTEQYVLQAALTQDRSRDGKIDDEYIAASLNSKFAYANFERDLLRVARDAKDFAPWITGVAIRTGVRHMAFQRDDLTEAQVGKVHHEHRHNVKEARSANFVEIFNEEKLKWSHHKPEDNVERLTYYGAVDTTPDLFSTIAKESFIHPEILKDKVYNEDLKKQITIAKGAKAAIDWVTNTVLYGPTTVHPNDKIKATLKERKLDRYIPFYENQILRRIDNTTGRLKELRRKIKRQPREYLLESQRVNNLGIYFQNITDGGLSTMHVTKGREGLLGNYYQPIAYLEVQVAAVNAFENAAKLYPDKAHFYQKQAERVKESTIRQFYMPEKKYFAAAVDRDETTGQYRKVETLSIMGASVLNSDLFDRMPERQKEEILQPILERLLSDDFITDAGLRTKSKQHAELIKDPLYPDANAAEYQGSWTVWPALNADIILGLRRQGFHDAAEQLENRLINLVHANSNAEYAFVVPGEIIVEGKRINLDGIMEPINYKSKEEFDALSDVEKQNLLKGKRIVDIIAPLPQGDQVWTASAVKRILYDRENGLAPKTAPGSWQQTVEQNIFRRENWKNAEIMPDEELKEFGHSGNYFFVIDYFEGGEMEDRIRQESEQKRRQLIGFRRT